MEAKEYDLIIIGTGSAMNLMEPFFRKNPEAKVAVIDKDEPGGICLTRGCIPSKILLYPADLIREIERADEFGVEVGIKKIRFEEIMGYMREHVDEEIEMIKHGLENTSFIDYYQDVASFVAPYTLKVGEEIIKSRTIFYARVQSLLYRP